MRDFYPEDLRRRERLFNIWKRKALMYGFEQYEPSVVESLSLLKRKAGEEIVDQIYHFKDKSERELALRPELTPSLARMIAARRGSLKEPIKWFCIGQCFRYERMTTGRKREHYQFNVDVLGEGGQMAEVELLSIAIGVLQDLQLSSKDVVIKIGNRQLLLDLLLARGFSEGNFPKASLILDKKGKLDDVEIHNLLKSNGLLEQDIGAVFDVMAIRGLEEARNVLSGGSRGLDEIERLFDLANTFNISDWLEFDISTVRGLSYYTGTVFEAFDREGRFRAIFGGGRYDNLVQKMYGFSLPAVGFGFGDIVVDHIIEDTGKRLVLPRECEYLLAYTDRCFEKTAIELTQKYRDEGSSVFFMYKPVRFKKALEFADSISAKYLIIIDSMEFDKGKYVIKNLSTGDQVLSAL